MHILVNKTGTKEFESGIQRQTHREELLVLKDFFSLPMLFGSKHCFYILKNAFQTSFKKSDQCA